MARSRVLLEQDARRFRQAIRPSLVGNLARIEPAISAQAAEALYDWLFRVINETMRATRIRDSKGEIARQLRDGVRVTGRGSLAALRGAIWASPWIFAHEYGAHIVPRTVQYLTIPIFYGVRPDGSPKFKSARSWNRYGSFVYTQKATGKKFLAYRAANKELRIVAILVDYVDIPARLGLHRMSEKRLGMLLSTWGNIYLREIMNAGVINLWGARP